MPRKRLNWHYNDERQEFVTPSGRTISLREIVGLLEAHLYCNFDFTGPWTGWKMRGHRLIPPGGSLRGPNITATNARQFNRWLASFEAHQEAFEFRIEPDPGHSERPQDARPAARRASTEDRCGTPPCPPRPHADCAELPAAPVSQREPRARAQVIDMARFRQRRHSGERRT
jgi:hypothetical protein